MHHDRYNSIIPTPTVAPYGTPGDVYGCLSCHEEESSCGGATLIIESNCLACHVAADQHHTPVPTSCASCHESIRPADPHPQSLDCAFCHSNPGGYWQFSTYNHTPDTSSCILCHESERRQIRTRRHVIVLNVTLDAGNSWRGCNL